MNKMLLWLGLVSIVLVLSCSQCPNEVLLDSFEGEISPKTVDFGSADNCLLKVTANKVLKVCGEQSLKIDYVLRPSGYMWIARGYNLDVKGAAKWNVSPQEINWKKYKIISLQMYGRNSEGVIAFDLKDSGGEIWRFLLDDDFAGWKEIACPINQFFPRKDWQPDTAEKNEVIDYEFSI